MSEQLRNNLAKFNRKERFYVVKEATVGGFELADPFRLRLQDALGIEIPIGEAFMAMDYHLDWIYASLFLCREAGDPTGRAFPRVPAITASQEDVDLLIAAPDSNNWHRTNLIMIEAKGETSWTNEQATSKAKRLESIFVRESFEDLVTPHYLMWSPGKSEKVDFAPFPEWAKRNGQVPHLTLGMDKGLQKITRCNHCGKSDQTGDHWKVEPTSRKRKGA